ncbi:MAG: C2 family cysteine protease [Tepidisphaeraceae bacterium]
MKKRINQNNAASHKASSLRPARPTRVQRSPRCLFEALEGRALLSASVLAAPTALTATASAPTTVQLHWRDNDATATGYYVLRSTDGIHYSQISKLISGAANSFTDATALSGHVYDYDIQAYKGTTDSAVSTPATATTPLAAVSGLTASATGPKIVQLNWTDNDSSATGYYVLRATDGIHFTEIANVATATAKTYTDATALSGHVYQYEIEAFDPVRTAPASNAASAVTPLVAPTALTATLSGLTIKLAWTDADSSATGYYVLRSTDNVHFNQIAALNTGSANSYSDSATAYGTTYYYKVEAFDAVATSAASAVLSKATPAAGVSIATQFGDELVITAAGVDDSISVSERGYTFTITADGATYTDAATTAGLFIYARGGTDTINIANSVTSDTTLETIDGAVTTITSAGTDVTSWIDSTDIYSGTGDVHRVATFAGGVSKTLGAALANPKDAGATVKVSASLFGAGPVAGDVNQGEVGDCYFLSSLAAFAGHDPNLLVQSAVDMGDGTYVVQFMSNNQPVFVRVSNAFSTGPFGGFMFAHPGSDGTIWAMVMEKAFCDFRTGANTYASINGGWMGDIYTDLGVSSTNFFTSSYTVTTLFNLLSADLAGGDAVTLATSQSPPNLVGDHAYTLVSVTKDSAGVAHYVVRNPWGVAGDAIENSQGYATLTFAQMVANFVDGCA